MLLLFFQGPSVVVATYQGLPLLLNFGTTAAAESAVKRWTVRIATGRQSVKL